MQKRLVIPVVVLVLSGLLVGCPPHPRLELGAHTLHFAEQETVKTFTIANTCWRSRCSMNFTIAVEPAAAQAWVVVNPRTGSVGPNQQITVTVTIAPAKAAGFSSADLLVTTNGGGEGVVTVTTNPNYYTEQFGVGAGKAANENPFDLENKTLSFIPRTGRSFYEWSSTDILDLPIEPLAESNLPAFLTGDTASVQPLGNKKVWLYGQGYDKVYVTSQGRILMNAPSGPLSAPSLDGHFSQAGISALYTVLDAQYGTISALQTDDELVVTYKDVPTFGHAPTHTNTFQVEMFFNDAPPAPKAGVAQQINLSYLDIDDDIDVIVGLSQGLGASGTIPGDDDGDGIPDSFLKGMTDLSTGVIEHTVPLNVSR